MIINDKYKIESDGLNIILLEAHVINGLKGRKSTKIGETRWQPIAYFHDFHNSLDKLVDNEIKGTGLKDYETIVKKIDELYALIRTIKPPSEFTKH
jgi:hypothetical protein